MTGVFRWLEADGKMAEGWLSKLVEDSSLTDLEIVTKIGVQSGMRKLDATAHQA